MSIYAYIGNERLAACCLPTEEGFTMTLAKEEKTEEKKQEELQEANTCVALGAGVGALGLGSALLVGAVCPLCVVVSPALIGLGLVKRLRLKGSKAGPAEKSQETGSGGIEPEAALAKVRQGARLIDVRSAAEFAAGHLEGALNIPHNELAKRALELGSDRGQEMVVYCRSGGRAHAARETLLGLGFVNVYSAGGLAQLLAAGELSVDRGTGK